ncbi:hypothetical protein FRC04_009980 [Tulasnella sp. 424]|nr:hypothetical protein FRC04_009980 [Tulasnella sp. 424]
MIKLLGLDNLIVFTGYNDTWRKQRAHLKVPLSASVVKRDYSALLEAKAREYLECCFVRPESSITEISRIVAEAVIKLIYGRLEDKRGRDYIQLNLRVADILFKGMQGYVVDLLPALQYLPEWLPGMNFKRDAAKWKREVNDLEYTVFESAKENMLSDDPESRSSFMFKGLQEIHQKYEEGVDVHQRTADELALARIGLSYFLGGVETTQSALESFIYAMTLFPSAQKKAQDEIDRVVGSGRFPTFEDQSDLPFLHALVLEILRWHPVGPSGVPHISSQDDTYGGYFIPQGTSIIVNVWGLTQNSKYYKNPSVFDPERYLRQPPELDPREYAFGFGRRICPGKDLAFQHLWITVVSILWAFQLVGSEEDAPSLKGVADQFTFGTTSSFRGVKV